MAIEMDCAGATFSAIATFLGPGEADLVSKGI
jgi:hypothetical protein